MNADDARRQRQNRAVKLFVGVIVSFGLGIVVSVITLIGILAYRFATGHLHASSRPTMEIYLLAPALGTLVALVGGVIAVVIWVESKPGNSD